MNFGELQKFLKKQLSKAKQLEAVKQNGYSIRFIHNPDKEVQLEAVKQDGNSIRFIHTLTPELLIAYLESKECPEELKQKLADPKFDLGNLLIIKEETLRRMKHANENCRGWRK